MSASTAVPAASPNSIIPASGISHLAKLLFVTSKLFTRNLINKEEKRILKQMAIRGDPTIVQIDLNGDEFLTQLIDIASAVSTTSASSTFNQVLYRHCSTTHGKTLSKKERKERGIDQADFTYGEIDFTSFAMIIKEIRPLLVPNGVFVDLGSGTGRPCFAMALISDFRKIIGIEALSSLVDASKQILEAYETFVVSDDAAAEEEQQQESEDEEEDEEERSKQRKKKQLLSPLARLERRHSSVDLHAGRIELVCADFTRYNWWSKADFVFMNSTCYSAELMQTVSRLAEKLKPGAIVVSLTKSLVSSQFIQISKKRHVMSWGAASVFVQQRK